jgi:hypothetical protein
MSVTQDIITMVQEKDAGQLEFHQAVRAMVALWDRVIQPTHPTMQHNKKGRKNIFRPFLYTSYN